MLDSWSPVFIMSSRRNSFHHTSHHCVVLLRHVSSQALISRGSRILVCRSNALCLIALKYMSYRIRGKSKLLCLSCSMLTRSLRLSRISLFSTRIRAQIVALFTCFSTYHLTTSNLEPYASFESLGDVPYLSSTPPPVNSSCAPECRSRARGSY